MKKFSLVQLSGLLLGASLLAATPAGAQDFPNKPVRLIVPTPAGSGPDADARQLAARLAPLLGQPVVIENRPGAAARIAIDYVTKAPADGYTLLVGTPSLVTAPSLYGSLPYDARRDLAPVSLVSTTAYGLTVNVNVPAQNIAEYLQLARSQPAAANVATYGVGTLPHLAGAWFGAATHADLKFIHYNTTTPFADLVAGQTSAIFDAVLPVIGNIKAKRLKLLAISGKTRHPLLPEVPTFAEAGVPNFDPMVWIGILAPTGTPKPVIDKLSAAIAQVARMPEIVEQRREAISESVGSTPEAFGTFIEAERVKWSAVIQRSGVRLD